MILRQIIRWTTGIDMGEAMEREKCASKFWADEAVKVAKLRRDTMQERDKAVEERDAARADAHAFWTQRDAARDHVKDMTAKVETLLKTNAMFRSLIGILRDCNRELDERNVHLEQLNGMTPGERLSAVENDAPDRCTKRPRACVDAADAADRLEAWQGHGTNRWGLGVAIDLMHLEQRVTQLERRSQT